MSDPILPPDLPPEYAEAYRRGYERAYRQAAGEQPDEPEPTVREIPAQDADAVEDWKRRVDFAKQLDTYTEYSLYAASLQTTDPNKRVQLGEALITLHHDSTLGRRPTRSATGLELA